MNNVHIFFTSYFCVSFPFLVRFFYLISFISNLVANAKHFYVLSEAKCSISTIQFVIYPKWMNVFDLVLEIDFTSFDSRLIRQCYIVQCLSTSTQSHSHTKSTLTRELIRSTGWINERIKTITNHSNNAKTELDIYRQS